MLELFLDTETTGFIHPKKPLDHTDQPHLVQLAMILREGGKEVAQASLVVRCPIEVPEKARAVHGYDQARTQAIGVSPATACALARDMMAAATVVIAHNAEFDCRIMAITMTRAAKAMPAAPWFCTMVAAEPHCRIPATPAQIRAGFKKPGDFKQPKLEEALDILVGEKLENAHDALADVRGCMKVYDWLRAKEMAA